MQLTDGDTKDISLPFSKIKWKPTVCLDNIEFFRYDSLPENEDSFYTERTFYHSFYTWIYTEYKIIGAPCNIILPDQSKAKRKEKKPSLTAPYNKYKAEIRLCV